MAERGTSAIYTARGQVEGEDWPAVAAALNERMAARRIGQQELARLSGVSVSTLRMLQHGASRRVQNKTLEAIARALDWPGDHLIGILVIAGQSRPVSDQPEDQVVAVLVRIEQQLQQLSTRLASVEQRIQGDEQPGSAPRR
jgi:DNA-binding Xre family transcriptional regulator